MVKSGKVDLGFVQGGIEIPSIAARLESPDPELILWCRSCLVPDLKSYSTSAHVRGRRGQSLGRTGVHEGLETGHTD